MDWHVAPPGDIDLAHFVTTKSYPAGNSLPLEAGVRNTSWFFADDQSISMSVDLDLGLDAVLVHRRPDPTRRARNLGNSPGTPSTR
jgi:hypothetical protein